MMTSLQIQALKASASRNTFEGQNLFNVLDLYEKLIKKDAAAGVKLAIAIGCVEDSMNFGDGNLPRALRLMREVLTEINREGQE